MTGIPRQLLLVATMLAIVAAAVWATTPPAVTMPTAQLWARCFEPIALPVPAEAAELALLRHVDLEDNGREPPVLLTELVQTADVLLNGEERVNFAGMLPAGREITFPAGATWPVWLDKGHLELRRADGSRFLAEPRTRFALHPAETYMARLAEPVVELKADQNGRVSVPQRAKVEIVLPAGDPAGRPIVVRQVERLLVGALVLPSVTSALVPDVRPDREAAPYLATRLAAPGLDFDPAKRDLRACLWLGTGRPQPIPIARIGTSTSTPDLAEPGLAELTLGLPSDPFPWFDLRRGRMASLAVVKADGTYTGIGQFVYPSRFWAFALATGLTLALFVGLVWLRSAGTTWKKWAMGLFLGEDGQPSLSLFQILLWTIVTVWALLFVFFNTGNLLTMTQQVMVLLGFAGVGSLAARWVGASRRPTASGPADIPEPRFWAVLENNNRLDLFKLQLFLFTLLIAGYVLFQVLRQSAFPTIEAEFLLLMGVSNGLYVGSKFGQPSPFALAEASKLEWDVLRLRVEDLETETARLESESKDLGAKISDPATNAADKVSLNDRKSLIDKRLTDAKAELAQARIDRDAKATAYKEALAALTSA